ncbi:unnamed protein product, partial [Adineta steineri]
DSLRYQYTPNIPKLITSSAYDPVYPKQQTTGVVPANAYTNLGINKKFGFSGRPDRPVGVLGTCKTYRICSKTVLCYPLTFETNDFYMSSDMTLLLDNIRSDFEFLT